MRKKLGLYLLHGRCSCLKRFFIIMCPILKSKFISHVSTTQSALPCNINRISLEAQAWGLSSIAGGLRVFVVWDLYTHQQKNTLLFPVIQETIEVIWYL
jgi:hypothetical protein